MKKKTTEIPGALKDATDLDALIKDIGDSRYVLLGEATHGTHEYYTWRAHITRRLIAERNFNMIVVEGDWPDCYMVNRYIKGYQDGGRDALEVLQAFDRWPTWMWGNWEMVALAEWLRKYNRLVTPDRKVGFYGMDVYSLWESLRALEKYLRKEDPASLRPVMDAMTCFEPFKIKEGIDYGRRNFAREPACEVVVKNLLSNIRQKMSQYDTDPEAVFSAEQNALVAVNAERYYHVVMGGGDASWNVRDRHMTETLNRLVQFKGPNAKVIVWAHNSHIGDARATDMQRHGLVNVGQLLHEEHHPEGVYRVGFGSYKGTVIAAYHWGGEMEKMLLPPAMEGSWEHRLHEEGAFNRILLRDNLRGNNHLIGHRAVGVVYDPDEESGNYVHSHIPTRYEAFVFIDKSHALHPLHIQPDGQQMPETYPWGV